MMMMTYVIDMTETGVLLRLSVILPVVLRAPDAVRQYRNVHVLVLKRVSTSLEDQNVSVVVLRQSTGEHRSRRTRSNCVTTTTHATTVIALDNKECGRRVRPTRYAPARL